MHVLLLPNRYTKPDYYVSMDPITTKNPPGDDGPETGITASHYMNTGVCLASAFEYMRMC